VEVADSQVHDSDRCGNRHSGKLPAEPRHCGRGRHRSIIDASSDRLPQGALCAGSTPQLLLWRGRTTVLL
jgi:hypothetical protein